MKNRRRPQNALQRPMVRWSWFFLLPMVSAFAIGFVWPFLQGIYLSFCDFRLISDAKWVGLKNYISVFQDTNFMRSFGYTAVFAVVSLAIINVLAFMVAMIFDGILSQFDTSILQESTWGFWGLIILLCWQQIGYMMIIYIAGLQSVPGDMLEAAKIDGASGAQTLFRVIIPNVMPSITICTFLSLTNGFKLFDQNLALTGGQPFIIQPDGSAIKTTEMLALNIYSTFYGQGASAPGYAQAKAVIFFILVAALGLLQLSFTRKREVQQ